MSVAFHRRCIVKSVEKIPKSVSLRFGNFRKEGMKNLSDMVYVRNEKKNNEKGDSFFTSISYRVFHFLGIGFFPNDDKAYCLF